MVLPLELVLGDLMVILNEFCSCHRLLTGVSVTLGRNHAVRIQRSLGRCLLSGYWCQIVLTGA